MINLSASNPAERRSAQRRSFDRLAAKKLNQIVENSLLLSKEKDIDVLFNHILFGAREIVNCASATLFLKTERNTLEFTLRTSKDELSAFEIPLFNADGSSNERFVVVCATLQNQTILIDDVYTESRFDLSGTKKFSEETGFRVVSMLTVPMSLPNGEVIGVLQLLNALDEHSGETIPFSKDIISYIEAMAALSAVALENKKLLDAQKKLVDSLINLIASAIDAKSPYTGGHCERVPELALMLAEEAAKVTSGSLADFGFKTSEEWYEFRIGALLHDCGKVTTPEYIADKATKLETIYNRINEIRTRFEVLLRDAKIERLESILGGMPVAEADATLALRKHKLEADFAFIASCNIGGEFIQEAQVARLREIGAQTWLRHFDNRLGISNEELRRFEFIPEETLPVQERLLDDKPEYIISRPASKIVKEKYNFKIQIPQYLNNLGELYNLSISRGTLNNEERFKINEHIMQTIIMLEGIPLPNNLKRVPEYASSHHETLLGTGYPRKLMAHELSIPARIMTIADIFEALTASDRPYKHAKTLSESVKILFTFKKNGHIDPVLFDLFLSSGVYKRYGARFLPAEQLDEVDISQFVG